MSDLREDIENILFSVQNEQGNRHLINEDFCSQITALILALPSLHATIEQAEKARQLIEYWQERALTAEGKYDKFFEEKRKI